MTLPSRDAHGRFVRPGARTVPPRRDAHGRFVSAATPPESTVPLVVRGPASPEWSTPPPEVNVASDRRFVAALIAFAALGVLLIVCAAIAVVVAL